MSSENELIVLLIEDSPTDALLTRETLAEGGAFRVLHVESLRETTELLRDSSSPSVDVALLDLGLPDGEGLDSLRRLRKLCPELPIVVPTGLADEEIGFRAVQEGAQDYVSKGELGGRELARVVRFAVERQRLRKELDDSRQSFQLFVKRVRDHAIFMMDPQGTITTWNEGAARIQGYAEEEAIGANHDIFFPSNDLQAGAPSRLRELAASQGHVSEEGWRFRKDGTPFWANGSLTALRGPEGELLGFCQVLRDLTERKSSESARQRSADLQAAILNCLPAHIALLDRDGNIVVVNESWRKFASAAVPQPEKLGVGINYLEICDRSFGECSEEASDAAEGIRAVLRGEKTEFTLEYPCHSPTRKQWFRLMVTPLCVAGRIDGAVVMHVDVTSRKLQEEALAASEERFRLLSRATSDAIWDWDLLTNSVWWNEGFGVLFGYSQDEVGTTVSSWTDRIHPDDKSWVIPDIYAAIENGDEVWSGEYRFLRKNGRYAVVLDRGHIIRDSEGRAVRMIGGMTDLTDKKHLEAQLYQSQKMESIGQLAGGIAHDFNNLLTIIAGYSELLLAMFPTGDEKRQMLAQIHDAGERATNLTRQLLAFSRKQVLVPRVLDLNQTIDDIRRMLGRLIGEDIKIIVTLRPDVWRIKVDPGQLEQVIINLSINARDAMPRGGILTLETLNESISPRHGGDRMEVLPGRYVSFRVSDTGCGMTPEVMEHIFEPFFTTKESGKGTGLGLATVFGIVKQSGGHIEVESETGKGTCVTILFPATFEADGPDSSTPSSVVKGGETILLVEDEPGVRGIARLALESQGYRVLEAENGKSGKTLCEKHGEEISIVVTDVVMPGMSGREMVESIRLRNPQVKILYMSGYTDDVVVRAGVIDQSDAFIEKPFSPLTLARKVREVLDQTPH
jgi:two-component system, cell cycle sensor histidine kinase and response regulator CckA